MSFVVNGKVNLGVLEEIWDSSIHVLQAFMGFAHRVVRVDRDRALILLGFAEGRAIVIVFTDVQITLVSHD